MAIAGRVAIVPKGEWSADATYKRLDAVTYNNTLYFAKKNVPAGTVTSNTEYWSKSIVGSPVTVDDTLSPTSTNPVQNKVIKAYVDKEISENVDFSTSTSKLLNGTVEAPLVLSNATRNLLNPTLQTITQDGITCTNNGDGTYTLNGTCSVNSQKTTIVLTSESMKIDEDVKFICCTQSGSNDTFRASIDYDDGTYSVDYGEGALLSKGKSIIKVSIIVSNGVTVNNLVFKPMLTTDLSATIDDFIPYSGYDIKTCGKNLLNLTKITTNNTGATASLSNGIITLDGTVDASGGWKDIYFGTPEQHVSLKRGVKYTISTKDKVQKVFILLREVTSLKALYTHDCYTNGTTFVASKDMVCQVTITFKESSTFNNKQITPQIEVGEKATEYEPYNDGDTVHIDSTTEFPLLGLKSFDGETNIISPGNVEVTYAKSDSGKAILGTSENKLDKDNVVNNQTTTEEGFALDARQANPNIDGTLAKQLSDLNGSLKAYEMKTLSIVDSNFVKGNRCGCALIQKRWILLNGEIDVDFTNVKNYTNCTALKSPVLPLFNTTLTAIDEDGMGYTGIFYADGRIDIAIRSYIPESKKQILRFSCIAFASI